MGCDIHILAEVRQNETLMGEFKLQYNRLILFIKSLFMEVEMPQRKWKVNTDKVFPNPWHADKQKQDEYAKNGMEVPDWQLDEFNSIPDDNRSYDWFSVLANVRNGYGFAGVNTGTGFRVIAEPRGVPIDATREWKETVDRWGSDMHSKSYLTLEDFDAFDWNQVTMKTGAVKLEEYMELRQNQDAPNSYCGSVGGQNIITISQEEADEHIKNGNPNFHSKTIYVQYYWPVVYSEWFDYKIKNTVEPLRKLKKKYGDARIVFGFDN